MEFSLPLVIGAGVLIIVERNSLHSHSTRTIQFRRFMTHKNSLVRREPQLLKNGLINFGIGLTRSYIHRGNDRVPYVTKSAALEHFNETFSDLLKIPDAGFYEQPG